MATPAKPFILYDNRFADSIPTATNTDTDYDVLNIIDWRGYTYWQADNFGTVYVTINCGSSKNANTLMISGHNFFTAAATVSLESSTNGSWTERVAGFTVTSNDTVGKIFTLAAGNYWRLKIVTASIAARIAILAVGVRMDFETGLQREFDADAQGIEAETKVSELAHPLGTVIKYYPRTVAARFKNLSPAWCANTFLPAWINHLSKLIPFFWAWEITGHPLEVYLVRLKDGHKLDMPYTGIRRSLNLDFVGVRE